MPNTSRCKKDDYAVIEQTRSVQYAFGSGRGREVSTSYHVVRVERATRDGTAKEMRRSRAEMSTGIYLDRDKGYVVMCLPSEMQGAARDIFLFSHPENGWSTADECKAALRAQYAKLNAAA